MDKRHLELEEARRYIDKLPWRESNSEASSGYHGLLLTRGSNVLLSARAPTIPASRVWSTPSSYAVSSEARVGNCMRKIKPSTFDCLLQAPSAQRSPPTTQHALNSVQNNSALPHGTIPRTSPSITARLRQAKNTEELSYRLHDHCMHCGVARCS